MGKLESEFKNAGKNGKRFRGAPFWSWNDTLDPKEIHRQVRELAAGGMGGHFMHSRPGLGTPYLSKAWMTGIKAAVAESKKLGLDAWLYDEDCWPSGAAAGKVQDLGKTYWAKQLVLIESDPKKFVAPQETLTIFLGRKSGKRLTQVRRVEAAAVRSSARPGDTVFSIAVNRMQAYVDLLSPKVTDAFLRLSCQPYDAVVGKAYGRVIPGIFTDEPGVIAPPWTENLAEEFYQRWGYDLSDHLLSLFYAVGPLRPPHHIANDWQKVRHDYWQAITDLLVNNFTKRYYQWCEARGLLLTGHMPGEDTLTMQTQFIGAAMPHYRWFHWPGVDHLKRRITDPLLNKQVTSVARQLGKPRVFSESFAGGGWHMSFEDMKWIWQWQAVQGVNFLCQHLSAYSLRGLRKCATCLPNH